MTEGAAEQPLYLASGGGTFAMSHPAVGGAADGAAVLLVPPFGWDDIASYRARRAWARLLAAAGHPALRIDLPGTGDSAGGPDDPQLVDEWIGAIADATTWLRATTRRERVAVIAIGIGGLLTLAAIDRGAQVDDVVLWGAPGRGRTAVRELRAFASLGEGGAIPISPELGVVVNGHALRPATVDALSALDAAALALPESLRTLVLDRDGITPDARLLGALESAGVAAEVGPGGGWGAMLQRPQDSVAPAAVFARVAQWLAHAHAQPAAGRAGTSPVAARDALRLDSGVTERPLALATPAGDTFGILTEPPAGAASRRLVLLLNAGAIRRIGPNRMYVEAARRWAQRGVVTLRLDLAGLGDADGDALRFSDDAAFHLPELREQVETVLATLGACEPAAGHATIMGLCSGAHWAFQTALATPQVEQIILLNPRALFWEDDLHAARDLQHYLSRARRPHTWLRALRGEISWTYLRQNAPAMLRRLARAPLRRLARLRDRGAPDATSDRVDRAVHQLATQGTRVLMLFTAEEPLYAELERNGHLARLQADATAGIDVRRIGGDLVAHTLQPAALQAEVHRLLDTELGLT
jgi:alpha-beta hydrolase superfamily lysophospholipase